MARVNKECFRIVLWMCFVMNMLVTTIYYLLSGATFVKLIAAAGEANLDPEKLALDRVWRAPLAATALGAMLVFGFNMFSCCVLIKKSANRSGPGFGYGFLVAFCFTLAFFCLLVGLIMDSFQEPLKVLEGQKWNSTLINGTTIGTGIITSWTKYSTELYIGAEVFAFVTCGMLLVFFLVLVIFQGAVSDQLGIGQDMNNPYVPMDVPVAAPAAGAAADGAAAGSLVGAPGGKAPSSSDPQYAQFSSTDYDQNYNQQGYNQYYQPADYQNTTEYQPNEYAYDQEQQQGQGQQGYQGTPYDAAYTAAPGGNTATTTPAYSSPSQPYAAPGYAAPAYAVASDHSAAAAASFYGQQGVYSQPAAASARRNEPQL